MPAALGRAANSGGRRTKTYEEGNRGDARCSDVPQAQLWGFEER
jgi:hypothetical protein